MGQKSEEELRRMHWRERYAYEAQRAFEGQSRLSEAQLVERIERDGIDPYFATWRAVAKKGTVENAAMALWRYLQRHGGKAKMLHRYHCAAALFQILGMADPSSDNPLRRRVQWDHQGEEARQAALLELKGLITARLPAGD